ncbi:transglutaminase domain-containing protein [Dyadobacter sp. LHD-138]|uniref:DUF3857 domain-containing protein n=1 Tax=Dyadobacter sp. LHD-138 TaxID=3071413 RepID=UPI0027E0C0E0|nr:transglutaminase domain-containing protein [Dyadobacter sp. LHD-138]MDQ6481272.1 DUF3857 domain-containing protein [Dyadobacter sp. LHD-138]
MLYYIKKLTLPIIMGAKMLVCIFVLHNFILTDAQAQKAAAPARVDFKPKLGVIDRASLDMTADSGDSTAEAVALYDYGEVRFSYTERVGIVMTMKYWTRIKILKESALDRASVSIPIGDGGSFDQTESISDISGYTYNLNGNNIETIQLPRKSVVREKVSDKVWNYKFNLQNVRKGSIIEYCYTKTTPLKYQDKPDTWTFQGSIPFKWSEYKITIPYSLYYKITMNGYVPLYITDKEEVSVSMGLSKLDGHGMSYRFVMKDAPAFSKESFITTPSDYLSKISFELASVSIPGEIVRTYSNKWEDVDKTLLMSAGFGGQLKRYSFIKDLKEEISKKTSDPAEKLEMAYAYIQQNIKWDENGGVVSRDGVKKAFENKKGNASDINLMLTCLLRELDLDSDPVVLSTRSHGQVYEAIPLLEGFNYVVSRAKIGEKEYLLDATQRYGYPGILPEHALNGIGRVIPDKGNGYFVDLSTKTTLSKLEMIDAELSPADGTLKGNYMISLAGYEALRWRENYLSEADNVYADQLKKQLPEWEINNVKIGNKKEKLRDAVEMNCKFEVDNENASPDILYFNPVLVGRVGENPFKALTRIYPIDFTSGFSSSFIGNYKLPEGYYLEETPKMEIITLPEKAGRFAYQVKQVENVISVNSMIMVNKAKFAAEEYDVLREFYDRIVQKHTQTLVIKKKK